ncbi:YggS family pyridoxal phosphate-dependent enzyme [candidate division KSB1 bacterium]
MAENLKEIQERIQKALKNCGDVNRKVEIVAVTKVFGHTYIEKAIEAGICTIGENRVQEAEQKFRIIGKKVNWHLVGHLQRNKAKKAVSIFELIHSVDSDKLANEIDKHASEEGKIQNILVQVNTSFEDTKSGIEPEKAVDLALEMEKYNALRMLGFMTIGPFTDEEKEVRKSFKMLKDIAEDFDRQADADKRTKYLSMGMTSDYEIAVEEGSNMVRIGSALFGARY